MRMIELSALVLFSVVMAACSSPGSSSNVSTEQFVTAAAASDAFEINSSKMIQSKTHDASVKQLATELTNDHLKSSHEMKTILASNGMRAPPSRMTENQKETFGRLKTEHHFNGDYLDVQEKAHKEAIDLFENYANNGDNAALRRFAAKTLPTLKHHLDMIEEAIEMRGKINYSNVRG